MVVRLDIRKAVFPKLDDVLVEILSIAAHEAFRESCELLGNIEVPKWSELGEGPKIALEYACRAVYSEIAIAGGAEKKQVRSKKTR